MRAGAIAVAANQPNDPTLYALAGLFTLFGATLQKVIDLAMSGRTQKAQAAKESLFREETERVRLALRDEQDQIFDTLSHQISDLYERDKECRTELTALRAEVVKLARKPRR